MNPVFSVVFFTITSGLGYGLLIFTGLMALFFSSFTISTEHNLSLLTSAGLGFLFASFGLLSSFFRLIDNKDSNSNTPWQDKERIAIIASVVSSLVFIGSIYVNASAGVLQIFALLLILSSLASILLSAMVYACLKNVPIWNTALVPLNYVFQSLLAGSIMMLAVLSFADIDLLLLNIIAFILTIVVLISKFIYFFYIGSPDKLSTTVVVGLPHEVVIPNAEHPEHFDPMGIHIIRAMSVFLMVILPGILLLEGGSQFDALLLAMITNYVGNFLERWLFFAEAKEITQPDA